MPSPAADQVSASDGAGFCPGIGFSIASCRAYITRNGVMIPAVSAGSNHVGASEMCTPMVNWPAGSTPRAGCPMALTLAPVSARNLRRLSSAFPICPADMVMAPSRLGRFQRQVLVRCGVGKAGYQAEAGLPHAGTSPIQEGKLPDRRVDDFLVHELLHAMQDCFALRVIDLDRLQRKKFVDVGIAAVDELAALNDKALKASRSITERAGTHLDDVLVLFVGPSLEERSPFQWPQPDVDTYVAQVVQDGLADVRIGRVAVVESGVKSLRKSGVGEQLLRFVGVEFWRGRRPVEFEHVREDGTAGDRRDPLGQRLIDRPPIDRKCCRFPNPPVVPRGFR